MENLRLYIRESIDELLNNVTWPTWPELVSSTVLVLVASTIFALVTLLFDASSSGLLKFIYSL
ncbi:MAG: preprotein translocase subunit SecE [Saprospiraceae bacterium]|jgi:preprotein translocase subunit SecE|nr:preprotein translocase subunit SecE [Saprospiraceae bacterium]MBK8633114.1 preprotein translocase subunit SecE [Saprospiraceae bacterium]HMS69826.1 preprotein translocase subunit SecE [Saprospiraceae bacterium]